MLKVLTEESLYYFKTWSLVRAHSHKLQDLSFGPRTPSWIFQDGRVKGIRPLAIRKPLLTTSTMQKYLRTFASSMPQQ